jgi:hypothetical protein
LFIKHNSTINRSGLSGVSQTIMNTNYEGLHGLYYRTGHGHGIGTGAV